MTCKRLDLIHRSMSDFAIHLTAYIVGEAASILSGREPKGVWKDARRRQASAQRQIRVADCDALWSAARCSRRILPVNLTFTAWDLGLACLVPSLGGWCTSPKL
jgi:hypothetical protein